MSSFGVVCVADLQKPMVVVNSEEQEVQLIANNVLEVVAVKIWKSSL